MILNRELSDRLIGRLQIALIIIFSIIPLFVTLPFKINLFLAWEGAYRMSIGQVPFRDFYLPVGFGFWLIPAFFFKIFGPYMSTLIKAQVLINLIGAFSLRSILRKFEVPPIKILLTLLVYSISFVFVNFWPWYNNTVFIFQLVAVHFLLEHIFHTSDKKKIFYLMAATFFLVLAFFTKQDGGALAILSTSSLLVYTSLVEKKIKWILIYILSGLVFTALFVIPFLSHDFLYWFNFGQAPHNSRVNLGDILRDVFEGSEWIKFYLLVAGLLVMMKINSVKGYFINKKEILFALFTFSILIQAILVQVTSYIPHNVNIYFHSIAFAFILHNTVDFKSTKIWVVAAACVLILFWWSADYWRYSSRIIDRIAPGLLANETPRNQISKYSWFVTDSTATVKKMKWRMSNYKTFDNVMLPEETIAGIDSIMKMDIIKKKDLKVLNMSELTPLAYEIGFQPSLNEPMWYHRNVSLFDREIQSYCDRISNQYYDLILFEEIPNLNQFNPKEVRKCLLKNYIRVNTFQAPRDNPTNIIEVYIRPN